LCDIGKIAAGARDASGDTTPLARRWWSCPAYREAIGSCPRNAEALRRPDIPLKKMYAARSVAVVPLDEKVVVLIDGRVGHELPARRYQGALFSQ